MFIGEEGLASINMNRQPTMVSHFREINNKKKSRNPYQQKNKNEEVSENKTNHKFAKHG